MTRRRRFALLVWAVCLAAGFLVIAGTRFTTDLSAFLPAAPTEGQRLLVEQLRDGMATRLILVGIQGADAPERARISAAMAERLRADPRFTAVSNGAAEALERDRAVLYAHRYLLSPTVTAERFTSEGLRESIAGTLDLLASSMGMLAKPMLPADPTGELISLLGAMASSTRPLTEDGVWVSRDRERALILAQTRAPGSDTDGQQQAVEAIRQAFDAAGGLGAEARRAELLMSGPGVFSVMIRDRIKREVVRLSALGTLLIATLLLIVYRSLPALLLGLLPVLTGAVAGVAAVSLGFGAVHGLTLGFGIALIGEAVDYGIYLFIQSRSRGGAMPDWNRRFWPTIRLGVLTSLAGFGSLLFSGFPGLAQLGLYSMAGICAAALVTRFLLPDVLPAGFRVPDVSRLGAGLSRLAAAAGGLRWSVVALAVAAVVVLFLHRETLWERELAALSPVSAADQALDARLRADLGAPDVRFVIVVQAAGHEQALAGAERVAGILDGLVEQGALAGYESPSRYLPSRSTQQRRRSSLPDPETLERRLQTAVAGLPVRAGLFVPFLEDVESARTGEPLRLADLEGSSLAVAVDSLLIERGDGWAALLPLRAAATGSAGDSIDAARVRDALERSDVQRVLFLDIKAETDRLYSGYLDEAIRLSLGGLAAIVGLLWIALRSPVRVIRVLVPLLMAVLVVTAGLALSGQRLILMHLVGMLLVAAVGSNYALFFDRRVAGTSGDPADPGTLVSLALANLTTVTGFGLLATSDLPVLRSIGTMVSIGVVLALAFSAVLAASSGRSWTASQRGSGPPTGPGAGA